MPRPSLGLGTCHPASPRGQGRQCHALRWGWDVPPGFTEGAGAAGPRPSLGLRDVPPVRDVPPGIGRTLKRSGPGKSAARAASRCRWRPIPPPLEQGDQGGAVQLVGQVAQDVVEYPPLAVA